MSRLLANADLGSPLQPPPFHNASCANPIEALAKHPDCFCAVVKFAELRRGQWCWLSECLDLNVDEHTDFILDGSGWGCHHGNLNNILADRVRSLHTWLWLFSTRLLDRAVFTECASVLPNHAHVFPSESQSRNHDCS